MFFVCKLWNSHVNHKWKLHMVGRSHVKIGYWRIVKNVHEFELRFFYYILPQSHDTVKILYYDSLGPWPMGYTITESLFSPYFKGWLMIDTQVGFSLGLASKHIHYKLWFIINKIEKRQIYVSFQIPLQNLSLSPFTTCKL